MAVGFDEISVAASEKHNRPVVTIVSAAAAVAAIAAVSAVVVGAHSNASRSILPGGWRRGFSNADPRSPVPQSATPTVTVDAEPITRRHADHHSNAVARFGDWIDTACRRTTTSPPRRPRLRVSRTCCPRRPPATCSTARGARSRAINVRTASRGTSSTTRLRGTPGAGTNSIQVTVTKVGGDSTDGDFASARAGRVDADHGQRGRGLHLQQGRCLHRNRLDDGWRGDLPRGPVSHGDVQSLVAVADSLVLLSPTDPRIVAPADCQVPAGSVCGSDSPTPIATPSPSRAQRPAASQAQTDVGGLRNVASPTPAG